MSESDVGVRVAATRQNAGRFLNGCAEGGASPGSASPAVGVNAPAATVWASVIVASGSFTDDRLSHDAAAALAVWLYITAASRTAHSPPTRIFMASPLHTPGLAGQRASGIAPATDRSPRMEDERKAPDEKG